MKLYSIASGSSGNATYLEHENVKILIDAGVTFKRISDAFLAKGLNIKDVTHVLLTHEHIDHVRGINVLFKTLNVPLYTSKGTIEAMKFLNHDTIRDHLRMIEAYSPFNLGSIKVTPLPLSHDAIEPLGFIFETETEKIGYITDTGYIRESNIEPLKNCDLYYFESNHDPVLLKQSNRPYYTIHRILTEKGHLSNEDSAYYLSQLVGPKTKTIIMAHISSECNTKEKIHKTYEDVFMAHQLDINNYKVYFASQEPLEVIEL